MDAFIKAYKGLTLDGNIIISVGLFGYSDDDEVSIEGTNEMLDDMHSPSIKGIEFSREKFCLERRKPFTDIKSWVGVISIGIC